jgi:tetratricopeptide (TPR) repeat protein
MSNHKRLAVLDAPRVRDARGRNASRNRSDADDSAEEFVRFKNLGLEATRQGRLDDAADSFLAALRFRPNDAVLRNELGNVLARLGDGDGAEQQYREALRLKTDFADAHNNLGNILGGRGKNEEADACFREALRLRPGYTESHHNLAITLRARGKLDEAIFHCRRALALRPDYVDARRTLAMTLVQKMQPNEAIECYHQLVISRPTDFDAHFQLGGLLFGQRRYHEALAVFEHMLKNWPDDLAASKGVAESLVRMEKFDDALTRYRQLLERHPTCGDAWINMGVVLERKGQHDEATHAFETAIKIRPTCHIAYANLAKSFMRAGRSDESVAAYRKSLELKPDCADTYNSFGNALTDMGRHDEAVACFTKCLELKPDNLDARVNRGLAWLRKGDFAQGWAEYESRWKKYPQKRPPRLELLQPQWNGFPLDGRTILLVCEQGIGDIIQFIRYAPILKQQGARVIFECREPLIPLMKGCPGVDVLIAQGAPLPAYDVHAPLLSLPGLLGTSLERIPRDVPYLSVDQTLVEKWRANLSSCRDFKVGINWQGSKQYRGDFHRSIPLVNFEPLSRIPGVKLFSLQKNEGLEQLTELGEKFGITDLGSGLDIDTGAFIETAAVLKNLDLFITSDTAVAHLAGALGVPVWMPVSTQPDWRWMTGREDSPWYPTMRLFRQEKFMDWGPVFARLAAELEKLVDNKGAATTVAVETAPGELIDKITILEIKDRLIKDRAKQANVRKELRILEAARDQTIRQSDRLIELTESLREVNSALWNIEDEIRACERIADFGPKFVELARSVYRRNDERASIKKQINLLLGSAIVEEKSYDESDAEIPIRDTCEAGCSQSR